MVLYRELLETDVWMISLVFPYVPNTFVHFLQRNLTLVGIARCCTTALDSISLYITHALVVKTLHARKRFVRLDTQLIYGPQTQGVVIKLLTRDCGL